MLIIFASSFRAAHPGVTVLEQVLHENNIPYVVVNPHRLPEQHLSLTQDSAGMSVRIRGSIINPSAFLMLNNWRTDAIATIPSSIKYPGVFRARSFQFLQDIWFAFENIRWIPGTPTAIMRADSKPRLMLEAGKCGLVVPRFTLNSSLETFNLALPGPIYRKSLGFPFNLSLNRDTGVEVGVTTTGTVLQDNVPEDGQLWQWQEPIATQAQIRCYLVQDRIWSAVWKRERDERYLDYRYAGQVLRTDITWEPYELPQETLRNLIDLMHKMNIFCAAPEFLLDEYGRLVFIDMNPCGDWHGFFSPSIRKEIAVALVNVVQSFATT